MTLLEGMALAPLRQIPTPGGPVLHAMKCTDEGYAGFGEAYFTTIDQGAVKAWKRHKVMISNLVVPVGRIRLQVFDDRTESSTRNQSVDLELGPAHYVRLTLPPGLWLGFQGLSPGLNLMLNIASIVHEPSEGETAPLHDPRFAHLEW